jgi:gamma-glutamylcyclotransferase (GGCT)/AIG2-like uncharacterized protein YtfP
MGLVKIFIYGTLKKGFSNNELAAKNGTFLGKAMTSKKYPMIPNDSKYGIKFPYLLDKEDHGKFIKGEIWVFHHTKLNKLDTFETSMYQRKPLSVIDENGNTHNAQAYFKTLGVVYSEKELLDNWEE